MSNCNAVDHFMQRAVRIPLLTSEEEIHLARSVQRMIRIQESKPHGPYTKAEQISIRRGTRAKERFISANIRLVTNVSGKYYRIFQESLDLPHEDLIQEGIFGLIRAVEKFDPERGYKFSTYAYWWIRQAIIRGVQVNGRLLRLPIHIQEKLYSLRQSQHRLAIELGRQPSLAELADDLKLPMDVLEHALMVSNRPSSLDVAKGHNDRSLVEVIADEASIVDQLDAISDRMDIERVHSVIHFLPKREREIIEMRYGLNGNQPATLHAIGAHHGITRERARQLCVIAMEKIHHALRNDPQLSAAPEWVLTA